MPKTCRLQPVCLEPLLFAFGAPRTIRAALTEYAQHLRTTAPSGTCEDAEDGTEVTTALGRFLDPIDAPLVALTPPVAQSLVRSEALLFLGGPTSIVRRAQRFFDWARERGYVKQNPFENLSFVGAARPFAPAA